MSRLKQKLGVFAWMTSCLSSLSTCKRNKVACIIAPMDFTQVLAIGYNGPVHGADNNSCTNQPGHCGCVHAEANALIKLNAPRDCGLMLITTCSPCIDCARLIVNARCITHVAYVEAYRCDFGEELLRKHNIVCAPVLEMKELL